MNMLIYHIRRADDREAKIDYHKAAEEVHAAGGALWTSLSHGVGPAFLVIALPPDAHLDRLEGCEPVASVDARLVATLDSLFVAPAGPESVPVVEQPAEQPKDEEQEETPDDEQSSVAW